MMLTIWWLEYITNCMCDQSFTVLFLVENFSPINDPITIWWLESLVPVMGSPDELLRIPKGVLCQYHLSEGEENGLGYRKVDSDSTIAAGGKKRATVPLE